MKSQTIGVCERISVWDRGLVLCCTMGSGIVRLEKSPDDDGILWIMYGMGVEGSMASI